MSRLCEEFGHRLPSEIAAEMARLPDGFLEELVEARSYANVKAARDQAKDKGQLPRTELFELVKVIEFELVQEEIDAEEEAVRRAEHAKRAQAAKDAFQRHKAAAGGGNRKRRRRR